MSAYGGFSAEGDYHAHRFIPLWLNQVWRAIGYFALWLQP
jgi:hypothetical protein